MARFRFQSLEIWQMVTKLGDKLLIFSREELQVSNKH